MRENWNASIHHILKAIDNHTALFLKTGLPWHKQKAEELRTYLHELKTWIMIEEHNKKSTSLNM